jgi:homoserine kinase
MALNLYLDVEMAFSGPDQVEALPLTDNLVYQGACRVFERLGVPGGHLSIAMDNQIPMGKGLGSSAAAWVAGIGAANRLLGDPLSFDECLQLATALEGHPDNVLPALAGGLTIAVTEEARVYFKKIPVEDALQLVVAVPDYQLQTSVARAVIPGCVPLREVVANLQRVSLLIASLYERDYSQLKLAMTDYVAAPRRKQLIPGFDRAVAAAEDAGALAVVISGAGPSVAAWTLGRQLEISGAMQQALAEAGVQTDIFILKTDNEGLRYL